MRMASVDAFTWMANYRSPGQRALGSLVRNLASGRMGYNINLVSVYIYR